jgi:hypothetical protein
MRTYFHRNREPTEWGDVLAADAGAGRINHSHEASASLLAGGLSQRFMDRRRMYSSESERLFPVQGKSGCRERSAGATVPLD